MAEPRNTGRALAPAHRTLEDRAARTHYVALPLTSIDPVPGPSSELSAALALQRAQRGGVAKLGEHYLDHRCPPICIDMAKAFDELVDAGQLALADPDSYGLRQLTLTDTGWARYAQLRGTPHRLELQVPDPQFPTKTPAGRRSSRPVPAPSGQPDSTLRAGSASIEQRRRGRRHDALLIDAPGDGLAVRAVSQRGSACAGEHASLPVRSPGAHMHPQLRRPAGGRFGSAGSNT
jgi:hypothetical protein